MNWCVRWRKRFGDGAHAPKSDSLFVPVCCGLLRRNVCTRAGLSLHTHARTHDDIASASVQKCGVCAVACVRNFAECVVAVYANGLFLNYIAHPGTSAPGRSSC